MRDENLSKAVGQRIRNLRLAQKLSLAGLGDKSGLTRQQVSKIELGAPYTPVAKYQALAVALGVSLASLFEVSPRKRQSQNHGRVRKIPPVCVTHEQ